MNYSWDEEKRAANIAKHGVDFEAVFNLDWNRIVRRPDRRFDYGEDRMIVYARINGRLHTLVYAERGGVRRIISLRKANNRETQDYEREIQT